MSIVFYVYMKKDFVNKQNLEITVCVCLLDAYV